MPILIRSIERLLAQGLFSRQSTSVDDLKDCLEKKHIPLVLVDHNILAQKKGQYQGHMVVVTGHDQGYIYFHDSGPAGVEANKKVDSKIFEKAMQANGTDNDFVVAKGLR